MNGEQRRNHIQKRLSETSVPVSASTLAAELGVSRQIIVQDIALLRAQGLDILSLARGYKLPQNSRFTRVFKVYHTDERVEEELNLIVDLGGTVEDVFVSHRTYGTLRAKMGFASRAAVQSFLSEISSGKSSLLKNVTSGYHYHTVSAASTDLLDRIALNLEREGFLAPLQDYEPEELHRF